MPDADRPPAAQPPPDRADANSSSAADSPSGRGHHAEVLTSVHALPPGLWERLAPPDDPMWGRDVFAALERSRVGPAGYAYVLIRYGAEPVALLPLCLFPGLRLDRITGARQRRLLAPVAARMPRLLHIPALICGHPLGQGRLLTPTRSPLAPEAAHLLVHTVQETARRERLPVIVYKDFTAPDLLPLRPALLAAGFFPAPALPDTQLSLTAPDFDGYLAALPAKPRRNARSKIRAFRARPEFRIEVLDEFTELLPRMHALYLMVMDRAEQTLEVLDRPFFAALHEAADPSAKLVAAFEGDTLVGFLLCLFRGRGAVGARIGLDYRVAYDARLYHNLHYAAIRLALEAGCRHIRFAQTAYQPKQEMGCALVPQQHVIGHLRPLPRAALRLVLPRALGAARADALAGPHSPPGPAAPAHVPVPAPVPTPARHPQQSKERPRRAAR